MYLKLRKSAPTCFSNRQRQVNTTYFTLIVSLVLCLSHVTVSPFAAYRLHYE